MDSLYSINKLLYQLNDIEFYYLNIYLNLLIFDINDQYPNIYLKYDSVDMDPKINTFQILDYLNQLIHSKHIPLSFEEFIDFHLQDILKEMSYKKFPNKYIIVKVNQKDYFITKHLSSGMNASVYLAIDLDNHQIVALKLINLVDPFLDKEGLNREVMCLQLLKDVCKKLFLCYIDSGYTQINHQPYFIIATEFLKNYITLLEFKNNFTPSAKEKINIDNQLIKSILQLKKLGISHNDLHPKNILIHPQTFDIKVIDFGTCLKSSNQLDFTSFKDILFLTTSKNILIKTLSS